MTTIVKHMRMRGASKTIFSNNLKKLMDRKGVKPSQLASEMNISPFRVDRWLAKVCFPKYEQMILLCDYLDYTDIYSMVTVDIDVDKPVHKQ